MSHLFNINGSLQTGADFSPCRVWRYTLWRIWEPTAGLVSWIGLNPSTATETVNDPTVERCQRRTQQMGFGGMLMLNLFAFRATDPDDMKWAADPVGPETDQHLIRSVNRSRLVVACWGVHGTHLGRGAAVIELLRRHKVKLHCLGLTADGHPKHPLYVPYETKPVEFSR